MLTFGLIGRFRIVPLDCANQRWVHVFGSHQNVFDHEDVHRAGLDRNDVYNRAKAQRADCHTDSSGLGSMDVAYSTW